MGAYPASVSTFTVTGRLWVDSGDGVDVGADPDVNPQEGVSVTFTPQLSPKRIRVPGFGLVDIEPVAAVTDADGYVKTLGGEDVVLAYGGDPDITPTGWTWLVSIEATSVVPEDEFSIAGSAGGTVDLSEFASVSPADPGAEVVAWVSARDAAIAAKDDAEAAQAAAEAAQAAAEDAQAAAEAVPTSNDGIVAGLIGNTASSTRGQLDAATATVIGGSIAPSAFRRGRKLLVLGDSHTAGAGASNVAFSYSTVAARLVGTETAEIIRAGYAGERSDQLLARLPGLLDTHDPGVVWVMAGTNDASQAVEVSTFLANIEAMKVLCALRGIPFIVGNVPPNGASATSPAASERIARVRAYNLALAGWAFDNGVTLSDQFGATVDTATGYMAESYNSGDHIHFGDAGHAALAAPMARAVARDALLPPWPVTAKGNGLLPNPLNVSALGGWSAIAGTPDPSSGYIAATDGDGLTAGGWFRLDKDNTAGGAAVSVIRAQNIDMTGVEVGDVLACYAKYRIIGDVTASLRVLRGTSTISLPVDSAEETPLSGTIFRYTVQAADIGQTMRWGFSVSVAAGASGSVQCGQLDVFNLTKLGVA